MTRTERLCRALLITLMCGASVWGVWQLVVAKPAIANNTPPVGVDKLADAAPVKTADPAEAGEAIKGSLERGIRRFWK